MTLDMEETLAAITKMFDHPHQWYGGRTYAQHGDDLAIINLFKCLHIDTPSYIDIGAHHPFHLSNTALLYARGSRGINVEANPALIDNFKQMRPDDVNVWAAVIGGPVRPVGAGACTVWLNRVSETSGINSLQHIDGHRLLDTVEVPALTINEIGDIYFKNGVWPDLLTIDVEGMDIPILKSMDYSRDWPKVICAEFVSPGGDVCAELRALMLDKGYTVHSFAGSNMLLVRTDLIDMCR